MEWTGHVARMKERCIKIWSESLKWRDHSKYIGVDARMILK